MSRLSFLPLLVCVAPSVDRDPAVSGGPRSLAGGGCVYL